MRSIPFQAARALSGLALLATFLAAPLAVTPAAAAVSCSLNRWWINPVNGSVDDPTKWNPMTLPGSGDCLYFTVSGTYSVTFPGTVPQTNSLLWGAANITFNTTSPHTTQGFWVGSTSPTTLTMTAGRLNTDYLQFGNAGAYSLMKLVGPAEFHSRSYNNSQLEGGYGDHVGHDGVSEMYVQDGAQYYSEPLGSSHHPIEMASVANSASSMYVFGYTGSPRVYSGVHVTGPGGFVAGYRGSANLFAYNGGYMDIGGDFEIGWLKGANGYVHIGPGTADAMSWLDAKGRLEIGYTGGYEAGHGELEVNDKAWVRSAGLCVVGDPDNDTSSLLRVRQGGTFTANAGLRFWPVSGPALDLQGGRVEVLGGKFEWPSNKMLPISSTTGTPELRIANGTTNSGPFTLANITQLLVGNNGNGTLRITGAGTVFWTGLGTNIVGQSPGGVGAIVLDQGGTLTGRSTYIAVDGNGSLDITGGSVADLGTVGISAGLSGNGQVHVQGQGSLLKVKDNLWIGGGYNGQGSTALVEVDNNAGVEIIKYDNVNQPLTTIYPFGTLVLSNGGRLTTAGGVSNNGGLFMQNGRIQAQSVSQPTAGRLNGYGLITGMLQSSGRLSPSTETGAIGELNVTGSFTQFSPGRYAVDLGATQCDRITINGPATLAGTLELHTVAGSPPGSSNIYIVLTGTSVTGTFENVTWNGSPLTTQASVVYEPTRVLVVMPGVAGAEDPVPVADLRFAPAGGRTTLGFALDLPEEASVEVRVFDVSGREIETLFDGALAPGHHRFEPQEARDLPNGAYFARATIAAGGRTIVRTTRAMLVR